MEDYSWEDIQLPSLSPVAKQLLWLFVGITTVYCTCSIAYMAYWFYLTCKDRR
jgi:hypothetical protein